MMKNTNGFIDESSLTGLFEDNCKIMEDNNNDDKHNGCVNGSTLSTMFGDNCKITEDISHDDKYKLEKDEYNMDGEVLNNNDHSNNDYDDGDSNDDYIEDGNNMDDENEYMEEYDGIYDYFEEGQDTHDYTYIVFEYFTSTPYACDPSSLPTYPPNKEFDAKISHETRRKAGAKARASGTSRSSKTAEGQERNVPSVHQESGSNPRPKGTNTARGSIDSSYDALSEASQETDKVPARSSRSGPLIAPSTGYAWTKQPRNNKPVLTKYYSQNFTRSQNMHELEEENKEFSSDALIESVSDDSFEEVNREMRSQKRQSSRTDLFDASNLYDSPELPVDYNRKQGILKLSGPLLTLPDRLNEDKTAIFSINLLVDRGFTMTSEGKN